MAQATSRSINAVPRSSSRSVRTPRVVPNGRASRPRYTRRKSSSATASSGRALHAHRGPGSFHWPADHDETWTFPIERPGVTILGVKIRSIVRLVAFGAFAATFVLPIASLARDSSHDFDFEFGGWRAHLMVRRPLSNTHAWKQFDGTSIVRKIWNGQANLGELEVAGPSGKIEAFSLRLYDPPTREWHVYFATSESGSMSVPRSGISRTDVACSTIAKGSPENRSACVLRFPA